MCGMMRSLNGELLKDFKPREQLPLPFRKISKDQSGG